MNLKGKRRNSRRAQCLERRKRASKSVCAAWDAAEHPTGVRKLYLDDSEWNPWVKEDHNGSAFLQRTCIRKKFTMRLWRVPWLESSWPASMKSQYFCSYLWHKLHSCYWSTFYWGKQHPASLAHHVHAWFCGNVWLILFAGRGEIASYKLLWVHLLFHTTFFHCACRQQPVVFCA